MTDKDAALELIRIRANSVRSTQEELKIDRAWLEKAVQEAKGQASYREIAKAAGLSKSRIGQLLS